MIMNGYVENNKNIMIKYY